MKELFKTEVTLKTTLKKEILSGIISGIFISIILFLIFKFGPVDAFIEIFQKIKTSPSLIIEISLLFMPVMIICVVTIKILKFITNINK